MEVSDSVGLNPSRAEFMNAVRQAMKGTPEDGVPPPDYLVVYYSGHGFLRSETDFCLATVQGSREDSATFFSAHDLIAHVHEGGVREVVVILDACFSAEASSAFGALRGRVEAQRIDAPSVHLLTSAGRIDQAGQMVFADAFAAALREPGVPNSKRYIDLNQLVADLKQRMSDGAPDGGQRSELYSPGISDICRVFPNPRNIRHNLVRPAEAAPGTGWRFCGRHRAIEEIVAYLEGDGPGELPLLVTGAGGSGKSALLLWLEAAANGEPLRSADDDAAKRVPPGCVDVLVDARDSEWEDVLLEIGERFDVQVDAHSPDFFRRLQDSAGPQRIMVDSVHRANAPDELTARVLVPLARLPSVRLVLTSDSPLNAPAVHEIPLDSPEYFDPADVKELARSVLRDRSGSRHHGASHGTLDRLSTWVAKRAGRSFLRAYLFALDGSVHEYEEVETEVQTSVAEIFEEQLTRLAPDDPTWAADLLAPLSFALGPGMPNHQVWIEVVRRLTGRRIDQGDLVSLLQKAREFVTESLVGRDSAGWRLQSEELALHLARRHDEGSVHAAFVEALMAALPQDHEGRPSWFHADRYTRFNFAEHACWAGSLKEHLDDPDFLLAMDARRLRRALTLHGTAQARTIREICDLMRGRGRKDGCDASRLSFLAGAYGRDVLAERAKWMATGWTASWIGRDPVDTVAVVPGGAGYLVVGTRDGGVLVCGLDGRNRRWLELLEEDPVTALDAGMLAGRPYALVGRMSGRVTLHGLDTGRQADLDMFDSEIVTCVVGDGDLHVCAFQQWRSYQVGARPGPKIDTGEYLLTSLASAFVGGDRVAVGTTATEVLVWNARGELLDEFGTPQRKALTAVTAYGANVVTASDDGTVYITGLEDGGSRLLHRHGDQPITSLRLRDTPVGRRLLTTSLDGSLIISSPDEHGVEAAVTVDTGFPVQSADLDSTGRLILGTEKGTAHLSL